LPSVVLAAAVNNYPDYTEDFQVSPVPRSPASCKTEGEGTAARTVCVDNPDDDPKGLVKNGNLPVSDPTGVHTLQDVPVYATGPGAAYFGKVFDQTEIFFGMAAAIGLDPSATDGKTIAGLDSAKPVASGVQIPADTSGLLLLALGIAVGFVARGRRPVTR
jgi:alkaline phosphatase